MARSSIFAPRSSPRSVAVEVLDRSRMSPGDLIWGDTESVGNSSAIGRAGRPAAQGDRSDATFVEAGALGQVGDIDGLFATEIGNGTYHGKGAGCGMLGGKPIRPMDKGLRRFCSCRQNQLLAGAPRIV